MPLNKENNEASKWNWPTTVKFDEKYGVLTDEQGIMLPRGTVEWLEEVIAKHKAHSVLELESIGRRTVQENCPGMVNQFNWEYFE